MKRPSCFVVFGLRLSWSYNSKYNGFDNGFRMEFGCSVLMFY